MTMTTSEPTPDAPVVPQEGQYAVEPPIPVPGSPQARRAPYTPLIGTFEREEGGYCYISGVPQALRRGFDIESTAKIGDRIECLYGKRNYGYGWYGTVFR